MRLNEDEVKIREKAGMLLLSVRVQPGATSDQIVGSYNGALKIRLVPRSINTVTFVASATASSSRSDDDAMFSDIVEEERQRNRRRPAATLWADGGCG